MTNRTHRSYGRAGMPALAVAAALALSVGTAVAADAGGGAESPNLRIDPIVMSVPLGIHTQGNLGSLLHDDDNRVVIDQRPAFMPTLPVVRMEISTFCTIGDPAALLIFVESASTALPYLPEQRIFMMNYDQGRWELIDSRGMTSADRLLELTITDNPQRFIDPQNANQIEMRLDVFDPGLVFYPDWSASFDQARWEMVLN